jgi:hypothetical protein
LVLRLVDYRYLALPKGVVERVVDLANGEPEARRGGPVDDQIGREPPLLLVEIVFVTTFNWLTTIVVSSVTPMAVISIAFRTFCVDFGELGSVLNSTSTTSVLAHCESA